MFHCLTVGPWLQLGCTFGCVRSSAMSGEAWPISLVGVYILIGLCPLVRHCHASLSHSQDTSQRHGRSGLAASFFAAYEREEPWYTGLATETPQWTPRPHSQPFLDINWGITLPGHSCRIGTCRVSRPSRWSSMCGLFVPALILRCSLCRRSVTASGKSLV